MFVISDNHWKTSLKISKQKKPFTNDVTIFETIFLTPFKVHAQFKIHLIPSPQNVTSFYCMSSFRSCSVSVNRCNIWICQTVAGGYAE